MRRHLWLLSLIRQDGFVCYADGVTPGWCSLKHSLGNVLRLVRPVVVSDEDRELLRKNGEPFDRSLFEKVYQRDFNTLEKDTAWYLDGKDCVFWWHRIAVHQSSYGLQGWQRNRVYPDFLACIHGVEKGKFRFSVLETKGDHLKGNDDTEYKQKLFDLLTAHASTAIRAGDLRLGVESEQMNFTMLLEDSWREKLENAVR